MAKQATIIDMSAYMASGSNANITITMTPTTGLTLDMFGEAVKAQLEALTTMEYTVPEDHEIVEFLGKDCAKLVAQVSLSGVNMTQEYYMFLEPEYSYTLIITWMEGSEAEGEALINAFSEY